MRRLPTLPALLLLLAAAAPSPMVQAFRDRNWTGAENLARRDPDPLAARLVLFIRLLTPQQASAREIDAWLAQHLDWPDRALLLRRRDEAIAADPDDATVLEACRARVPAGAPALLRCAEAARAAGRGAEAAGDARLAWPGLAPDAAASFLAQWGPVLRPDDDWRRFDRLAWANDPSAGTLLPRLDAAHASLARARLALRATAPGALDLAAAVPPALSNDPALILERARYLRRTGALDAAAALWTRQTAERAASPGHRAAFWTERDALARALLDAGQVPAALAVATDPDALAEQRADSLFLSGWIALRFAHDPKTARARFGQLADEAETVLTASRAHYWLGRAADAAGDHAAAEAAWRHAATYPVAFYGQLAADALGEPLSPGHDPSPGPAETRAFASGEMARAARLLCAWGDPKRARDFLLYAAAAAQGPSGFALVAGLARALGLTDVQVSVARLAGRHGVMLPDLGWPTPYPPPAGDVPGPLAIGLVRQESSFDPVIVSHAGAVGLMQLLPATAADLAHLRRHATPDLFDPAVNLRLGTEFLGELLNRFGGSVPLALAAYDAGPHRASLWRDAYGDPVPREAAIDWIERLPYAETRSYVQRVIENATLYAARAGTRFDPFAPPVAQ